MTLRLFWDRAGTGEPLLLLHGMRPSPGAPASGTLNVG
jgi:hypothetical protein